MMNQERQPKLFIQFAGQGVKYMDELRRIHRTQPEMRPFLQEAIDTVRREAASYDDSNHQFFSQGLDADSWIEQPEKTPDAGYLSSSPLSHPFIFLSQISNYISLLKEGVDPKLLLAHTHSVTGFSTGVVAATLVAMNLSTEKLCEMAIKVQSMFFWQGVRCQESMARFGVSPVLELVQLESAEGAPSCMASISNLELEQLKELIDKFSDYGVVHPAYELFPGRWIIAGLPQNLIAFKNFIELHLQAFDWKYIPSTIAAHSPFLSYALETCPTDAERAGIHLTGSDLKVPVWGNDMGRNLQESDQLIYDVMHAYFVCPAMWRKQIEPLTSGENISYVLDFGPGPGVASLTENFINGSKAQVIRCTVPLGRKRFFAEVLPSLQKN